ncbi:MRN complex-interacting protein [Leptidea sinapis]|uniref:MRN complex-interacting protein n=1 Tax=Leptidea sinapis TaxID=189913 RepID=UPI002136C4FF|nr:MRN complex-interacting protein [Leptidea sinapis]
MPQVFQVLRCYKCLVFQVHQTKKSNKWTCKLCEEKQSMKRHYGIGTNKECRMHVQKLNMIQGDQADAINHYSSGDNDSDNCNSNNKSNALNTLNNKTIGTKSKWLEYIDENVESTTDEPMYLEGIEVVLDVPIKGKKKKLNTTKIKSTENDNICNSYLTTKNQSNDFKIHKENYLIPGSSKITELKGNNKHKNSYSEPASYISKELNKLKCSNNYSDLNKNSINNCLKRQQHHKVINPQSDQLSKWTKFIDTRESKKSETKSQINRNFNKDTVSPKKGNPAVLPTNNPSEEKLPKLHPKENKQFENHSTKTLSNLFTLTSDDNLDEILNI